MAEKYPTLVDGEWCRPVHRGFREQCCHCALVHRVDFRVVDGHVEFRATVDKRATSAARRRFGFEKD